MLSPQLEAQQPAPFYTFESGSGPASRIEGTRKESPNFNAAASFLEAMGFRLLPETATAGVWQPERDRRPSSLFAVSFNPPPQQPNSFATIFAVGNQEGQTATRIGVFNTEGDRPLAVRSGYIAHSGKVRESAEGIRRYMNVFGACGGICSTFALFVKHPAAIAGCLVVACGVAVLAEVYSALQLRQCLIIGRNINVRREPTDKGAVIANLSNPTTVGCFEREGDWVPVVFGNNQDGYVHVQFLQFLTK